MNKIFGLFKKYREIIVYLIVGVLTTVVSYVSYFLFSRFGHFDYQLSTVLSWIVSVCFAYFANKIFVFRSKNNTNKQFVKEIFNFVKYRIFSLFIDMLLMLGFVNALKMNDLIAKAIVQVVIIVVNYLFSKFFVFNKN